MRGRLVRAEATAKLGGLRLSEKELRGLRRVRILACGTSWHAGMVGKYMIEELARLPTVVDYAAEFRYAARVLEPGTLVLAISQSGETADTLAAVREAKRLGGTVLGICNVVGSSIARECGQGVYLHAGPEVGVASHVVVLGQIRCAVVLARRYARRIDATAAAGSIVQQDGLHHCHGADRVLPDHLPRQDGGVAVVLDRSGDELERGVRTNLRKEGSAVDFE